MLFWNNVLKCDYFTDRLKYFQSHIPVITRKIECEDNFFKYVSPQKFFLHKNFCAVTMIDPYVQKGMIYLACATFKIYMNKTSRETLKIFEKSTL